VKFDKDAADPMLFPETVGTVQAARAAKEKIVQITHEYVVPEDARDPKERIYTERSWRPADGTGKAKACEYAVTGVIVVGPGRGEAHKVCLAKERCKTHWSEWQKERAAPAEGAATPGGRPAARDHWKQEEARRKAEQAREEAERARWKKAEPKILEAVAAAVKKASARATGLLAEIVLSACQDYRTKDVTEYVPRGTTAEDLVRHAAFTILADEVRDTWRAPETFPKRAKTLGLDVKKLVDQVAQPPKPEEPTKTKKAAKPTKAKARTKAKRKAAA
jgi:hypothetical protein